LREKNLGELGCVISNSGLDFSGDLDHDVDLWIFKEIFSTAVHRLCCVKRI